MASRLTALTRLLSPLRCSGGRAVIIRPLCSPPILPLIPSRLPIPERYRLFKNWGNQWIQPNSPLWSPAPLGCFNGRVFRSGNKSLFVSVLGFAIVNGMTTQQTCTAYALDDDQADHVAPSGYLKDEMHAFLTFVKRFQLPAVLIITVLLGWRHPLTLFINIALLLFSTRPNPFSVYMFIDQLQQRDISRRTMWLKSKFLYRNVKVEDYKFFCLATVELMDTKLRVLGILGGWWVVHTSSM